MNSTAKVLHIAREANASRARLAGRLAVGRGAADDGPLVRSGPPIAASYFTVQRQVESGADYGGEGCGEGAAVWAAGEVVGRAAATTEELRAEGVKSAAKDASTEIIECGHVTSKPRNQLTRNGSANS